MSKVSHHFVEGHLFDIQRVNRSVFGLRTNTKDLKTSFYNGTGRAKTGTMIQARPTWPFVDALTKRFPTYLVSKVS